MPSRQIAKSVLILSEWPLIQRVLNQSSQFKIAPFGGKAAMECALMIAAGKTEGDKRNESQTWAKAKFDWQIAAIAKSESA